MKVVVLSGGVGGARLLSGIAAVAPSTSLSVVVNVGDDFSHWGLPICPDVDTVMYTLAGLADRQRGWGVQGDTNEAHAMMARYGAEDWFALGDRDLATHLRRAQLMSRGQRLTEVTARLAGALDVEIPILPASDQPHPTVIDTVAEGALPFQQWLVRRRGVPTVRAVRSEGDARPSDEVLAALDEADVVVIGPSNPYVSIDPILDLPGVRERAQRKVVVAVSPIVAGKAIKGPLSEMIASLARRPASAAAIAAHYGALLDGFVVERGDEAEVAAAAPTLSLRTSQTIMHDQSDRERLARETLSFARELL